MWLKGFASLIPILLRVSSTEMAPSCFVPFEMVVSHHSLVSLMDSTIGAPLRQISCEGSMASSSFRNKARTCLRTVNPISFRLLGRVFGEYKREILLSHVLGESIRQSDVSTSTRIGEDPTYVGGLLESSCRSSVVSLPLDDANECEWLRSSTESPVALLIRYINKTSRQS